MDEEIGRSSLVSLPVDDLDSILAFLQSGVVLRSLIETRGDSERRSRSGSALVGVVSIGLPLLQEVEVVILLIFLAGFGKSFVRSALKHENDLLVDWVVDVNEQGIMLVESMSAIVLNGDLLPVVIVESQVD